MREIKFRAWDKVAENMFIIFDANEQTEWFLPKWKDRYEVMQYTGLKDRAGTEIYEGDILELINEADRRVKAICKFGKRRIMHGGNTIEMQGFYFEVEGRKTNPIVCNYKGLHDLEIMEVRGNIYENPELI